VNISKIITETITIQDILHKYGYQTENGNRIKCVIHGGKDKNFCYTDHVFHCWVCGAKGNVISLVSQIYGIDYKQAVTKINNNFDLKLTDAKPTYREILHFREIEAARQLQIEKAEQGRAIYNQLNSIRCELFAKYGDDIFQVQYLDRLLVRYGKEPSPLVDWQIDIDNLIINLRECAELNNQT